MTATYTGVLSSYIDPNGTIGPAGAHCGQHAGDTCPGFTAVFTYNSDAILVTGGTGPGAEYQEGNGGISATLTIADFTIDIGGLGYEHRSSVNGLSSIAGTPAVRFSPFLGTAYNNQDDGVWYLQMYVQSATDAPPELGTPADYPYPGSGAGTLRGPDGFGVGLYSDQLHVAFAPVPEPAAWAMMLVGFGGLGAMLRRRRPALG
jgi:hypothetical protein